MTNNELSALAGVDTPNLSHFWDWVKKTFTTPYRQEIEAYLAESVDRFDLEQRMNILARRGMI